jgi:transposase
MTQSLIKPYFKQIDTTKKASIKDVVINRVEFQPPKNKKEVKDYIEFYTKLLEYYKEQQQNIEAILNQLKKL